MYHLSYVLELDFRFISICIHSKVIQQTVSSNDIMLQYHSMLHNSDDEFIYRPIFYDNISVVVVLICRRYVLIFNKIIHAFMCKTSKRIYHIIVLRSRAIRFYSNECEFGAFI
jgi:hypothetical protein